MPGVSLIHGVLVFGIPGRFSTPTWRTETSVTPTRSSSVENMVRGTTDRGYYAHRVALDRGDA
jgi:hypothetical protein